MNLPKFSVKRPVTVFMVTIMVFIFGVLSLGRLGLDLIPDIDFPMVSVVTTYSGVSPDDIENTITKTIEKQVSSVENVKSVSSTSSEGVSIVTVEFSTGTNVDFAAQDVRSKIELIRDYLPSGADSPIVLKTDISAMPVVGYGITSNSMDSIKLKEFLEDNVEDQIKRIDGVASVVFQGGEEREILIELDEEKMSSYGILQSQVVSALAYENINYSGGEVDQGLKSFSIRTMGEFDNIDEIKNTVVASSGDSAVYVRDVANVSDTTKEVENYCRTNQDDSILMFISKSSGSNTLEVANAVKDEIKNLQEKYDSDINLSLVMDQSTMVENSVNSVKSSGIIGGILAIIIVYLFLKNWRPTFVIGIAIPFSLVATFIPIYLSGYTLNMMTLGGLVLGIGMFVDNAVVVIENIFRHLEDGKSNKKASVEGANEVGLSIIASTLTTIAIFLPMAFVEGIAGQLVKGMSLTVVFALFCSLLVALTLVPMMSSKIFSKKDVQDFDKNEKGGKTFSSILDKYKKILIWSLDNKKKVVVSTFVAFIISIFMIFSTGSNFMPGMENNLMIFNMKLPAGSSLEYVDSVAKEMEDIINSEVGDELESLTVMSGGSSNATQSSSAISSGDSGATFIIRTKDSDERDLSVDQIKEVIENNVLPINGLSMEYNDLTTSMMSGSDSEIEIKIFGDDNEKLKEISDDIVARIENVDGLVDIDVSLEEAKPEIRINIDRSKSAQYGLSVAEVGSYVKSFMQGQVATQFRDGDSESDIRVRFSEDYRDSLDKVRNISIMTNSGEKVFLEQIADISQENGFVSINREDQIKKVTITGSTSGRDLESVNSDIEKIMDGFTLPDGYFMEEGGSYEQMMDSFSSLFYAMILGIVLVYMIMASQFESLLYPFIVMFEIPLSFIGVGLILFITRQPLSLPAMMGIVVLAGIVVNNAIVLIDYINQLRHKGMNMNDAIIESGVTRLRPIMITSLTTVLGMLPLAMATGQGSEMMKPMAIAVIGGLFVSTILTLVVIPVIYSIFDRFSKKDFNEEVL